MNSRYIPSPDEKQGLRASNNPSPKNPFMTGDSKVIHKTANFTISKRDTGRTFTNKDATGAIVFTLPLAESGMRFCFIKMADFTFTITANTADKIDGGAEAGSKNIDDQYGKILFEATDDQNWITLAGGSGGGGATTFDGLTDTPVAKEPEMMVVSDSSGINLDYATIPTGSSGATSQMNLGFLQHDFLNVHASAPTRTSTTGTNEITQYLLFPAGSSKTDDYPVFVIPDNYNEKFVNLGVFGRVPVNVGNHRLIIEIKTYASGDSDDAVHSSVTIDLDLTSVNAGGDFFTHSQLISPTSLWGSEAGGKLCQLRIRSDSNYCDNDFYFMGIGMGLNTTSEGSGGVDPEDPVNNTFAVDGICCLDIAKLDTDNVAVSYRVGSGVKAREASISGTTFNWDTVVSKGVGQQSTPSIIRYTQGKWVFVAKNTHSTMHSIADSLNDGSIPTSTTTGFDIVPLTFNKWFLAVGYVWVGQNVIETWIGRASSGVYQGYTSKGWIIPNYSSSPKLFSITEYIFGMLYTNTNTGNREVRIIYVDNSNNITVGNPFVCLHAHADGIKIGSGGTYFIVVSADGYGEKLQYDTSTLDITRQAEFTWCNTLVNFQHVCVATLASARILIGGRHPTAECGELFLTTTNLSPSTSFVDFVNNGNDISALAMTAYDIGKVCIAYGDTTDGNKGKVQIYEL